MLQRPHALLAVSLLCLTTAFAPALQERTKKKEEAKTFPVHLTEAKAAWDAGRLGATTESLRAALGLVNEARHKAVLGAFPELGEGWTFEPSEYDPNAAMLMAMAGFVVEGSYRGPDSRDLSLTATMGSPMVQMFAPMLANPSFLGDDAELIKYGEHKALLQKNGDTSWELTIILGGDLVQARADGMTDEQLLAVLDQEAVDALAAALTK